MEQDTNLNDVVLELSQSDQQRLLDLFDEGLHPFHAMTPWRRYKRLWKHRRLRLIILCQRIRRYFKKSEPHPNKEHS